MFPPINNMDWLTMIDKNYTDSYIDINKKGRVYINKRKDRVRKLLVHLNPGNKTIVIVGRFDLRRQTLQTLCKWLKLAGIPDEDVPRENMQLLRDMVKDIRSLVTSDADRYVTGLSGQCEHVFPSTYVFDDYTLDNFTT